MWLGWYGNAGPTSTQVAPASVVLTRRSRPTATTEQSAMPSSWFVVGDSTSLGSARQVAPPSSLVTTAELGQPVDVVPRTSGAPNTPPSNTRVHVAPPSVD